MHTTARRDRTRSRQRPLRLALAAVALLSLLAGCSQNTNFSDLPKLAKDPQRLLTKDEQKQAISELGQKDRKAAEQSAAQTPR